MTSVPMASGVAIPIWPLPDVTRKRWTFKAHRSSKKGPRYHVGLDMYAPAGSHVLAPESGTIVNTHRFLGPNAVALIFQTDTGIVINFGEVQPGSWEKHGLRIGSHVEAGQILAEVGTAPKGGQMLHFETYTEGTRHSGRWYKEDPPPINLLNPTDYLRSARALDGDIDDIPNDDIDDDIDDDDDDHDDHDPIDPVRPKAGGLGPGLLLIGLALILMGDE